MTTQWDVDLSRISGEVHQLLLREVKSGDVSASLARCSEARDMLVTCLLDVVSAEAYLYLSATVQDGP